MNKNLTLTFIVLAQFAVTSLWFAGNAIYPELQSGLQLGFNIAPKMTVAVQLGFILGTFFYAIFMIPDRFSPSKVFLLSGLLAASFNLVLVLKVPFELLYISRLLVGFFMAGIYPVGMKIASDWFNKHLGNALGYLVGALVIGTAFPHFIKTYSLDFSWHVVVYITSGLSIIGGLMVRYLVGDGPHRKKASTFSFAVFLKLFNNKMFNRAAAGYFGHMWELYTFWAFLPTIIVYFNTAQSLNLDVSFWSFNVIAIGGIGCVIGGRLSKRYGSCRVAFFAMSISSLCGLMSLIFFGFSTSMFLIVLLIWGFTVVMDSPQFSSVIADYSDSRYLGSALTIVNSIGFAITIASIELIDRLAFLGEGRFWILAIGPILGLIPTGKIAFRKSFPAL